MLRGLFKFCISTIVERRRLEQFALTGRGKFTERRIWKAGKTLFEESRVIGEHLPVVLSDAAYDSETLLLWGVLQKLETKDGSTTVYLGDVKRVQGKHGRRDLTLRSTGKSIKPHFIRPYAICHTPTFLK